MPRTKYNHSAKKGEAITPKKNTLKNSDLIAENTKNKAALKEQLARIQNKQPLIKTPHEEFASQIKPDPIPVVEAPIVEAPIVEAPIVEGAIIDPIIETPIVEKVVNKVSLFEDMVASTEQDVQQISKLEEIGDSFLDDSTFNGGAEDSEEVRKTNAKISSGIWVVVLDVAAMLGCLFLSDDFSDESQRKFSLIPERKKAIQNSIYQLLMLRKKKTNPVFSLVLAILGSYAPMIVIAVLNGKKKRENSALERQRQAQIQFDKANTPVAMPVNPIPDTTGQAPTFSENTSNVDILNNVGGNGVNNQKPRVGTKGRHKIGCNWYHDKPCNCKQANFKRPK